MDHRLLVLINQRWTTPALDRLMVVASAFQLWLPFLVILLAATLWRGGARARWFLLCLGLTLVINDMLIGNVLKHATRRLRPFQAEAGVREVDLDHRWRPGARALLHPLDVQFSTAQTVAAVPPGAGRSFPSNHTTNNFCVATLLTLFYRRRGALYFLPAAVVGYSRVYTGSHWPSDVFESACLATGWLLCAVALLRWWLLARADGGPPGLRAALGMTFPGRHIGSTPPGQ